MSEVVIILTLRHVHVASPIYTLCAGPGEPGTGAPQGSHRIPRRLPAQAQEGVRLRTRLIGLLAMGRRRTMRYLREPQIFEKMVVKKRLVEVEANESWLKG